MSKYVILRDDNRAIDGLLLVENYDENFARVFDEAVGAWMKTDDEFYSFVFAKLEEHGYKFESLEYEVANST